MRNIIYDASDDDGGVMGDSSPIDRGVAKAAGKIVSRNDVRTLFHTLLRLQQLTVVLSENTSG